MRKILAVLLCAVCVMAWGGVASAEGYSGDLKVWVAENVVDFTTQQIDAFKAANPEYADMNVVVEPVGEGDAANNLITDVAGGADVFAFAQDQLGRLVAANALMELDPEIAAKVAAENDEGSVAAATLNGLLYAYPLTSDNGYFLYYDKSVVTDPTDLDKILADCEAAGKNFYMEINSGWYQPAFFFGAGCTLTYDMNNEGAFTSFNCDYASENGLKAFKSLIKLASSPIFVNASSASVATNIGAIVDGTWDAEAVQTMLGDNYAATKLPMVDGYQLGGFGGFKLMGIKPQEDAAKLAACDALAYYLASGEVQKARFEAVAWGPSNLEAQAMDAVKNNPALAALAEQLTYCIGQGNYPGDYWTQATALGDSIIAHEYDGKSDEELMAVLQTFQDTCASYASAQ